MAESGFIMVALLIISLSSLGRVLWRAASQLEM